jgi:plastocyanin
VLLAALSTGHKVGLGVVGGAFILFALTSSFVLPRRRPDFPGKNGLSVFVLVCFVFFFAMLTAVIVFGVESEAKGAEKGAGKVAAGPAHSVPVTESEFKVALPSAKVGPGKITFVVKNAGKIQHDLAVSGPGVSGTAKTPLIAAGATGKLTVSLAAGSYTLYCTVPGHRAAGMVAKLTVG